MRLPNCAAIGYADCMKFFRLVIASALAIATSSVMPANAQMMGGAMGNHTPPVPMTARQFAGARVGQKVQIAVRVDRRTRTDISAELLEHRTESISDATGKHVVLYFADDTPVVMGTASDINRGAILFVYGILTKRGHVDVKRLVVDTKVVRVQ